MGTVNVTLGEDARLNLILGQQLENAVTSVVFDFSAWQTAYGSGTLALSVQRPGDEQPYAVTLTTSGTDATWSVTDLDTAYKGVGHIQLTYTVGSAIKKSVVYKFTVYESLGANGEYPSPGQTWQEEIEDELADVKADLSDVNTELNELEDNGQGFLKGEFINGSLSSGNVDTSIKFRVTSYDKFVFDRDVTLTPDTGYRFGIHSFGTTGESFVSDSGWKTASYTITAGTYFRIVIQEISKTSGTADIPTNVHAVKVSTVISRMINEIETINGDLNYNNGLIYLNRDEITSITGRKITIDNGHIVIEDNPSNYWKTLLVPVECLYIDGTATLKSGGLSGNESGHVPTMAFLDENYDVVGTPVYTAISAPHTFAESDVPTGAVYVALCYSNTFVFAFKSVATKTKDNKQAINIINNVIEDAGKYGIELNFTSATGYYNSAKGYTTYEGVTVAKVYVNEGDVFYLTSRNYYGMARVAFMDESNACIAVLYTGNNTTNMENTRFVVPSNVSYMLIQTVYGYACTLWKSDIENKIDDNIAETQSIKECTTEPKTTDVELTFESATGYRDKNGGMNTYEGVTIAKVEVTEGQKYILKSRNYYNSAYAFFLDSNETFVKFLWLANNTSEISVEISIPPNVSYLVIQRIYTFYPTELGLIVGIEKIPSKSILNGKRITVIGDSITEKNLRAKVNWALYLHTWCGAVVQNLGASGTGFIAGNTNPYSNRIASINNPDIIGVALSFNDMSQTIEDLTEAAENFFDTLLETYSATPIICYVQSPWSAYHYGVSSSDAWVNALKEICNTRGIPFYDDMYRGSTLKPWIESNRAVYYMNDGEGGTGEEDWVHPNSEGHKAIARYLYPKFVENIVDVGLDYI